MGEERTGPRPTRWAMSIDAGSVLLAFLAGVLVILVALPLGSLAVTSIVASDGRAFTLAHYVAVFSDPLYLRPVGVSLVVSVAVATLSLVAALPLAWSVARTNMPGRRLIRGMVLGAFVMPPFLGAVAWVIVAGPNAGWLNRLFRMLSGSPAALVNIFSVGGLVFVIALHTYPYCFVLVEEALAKMSAELEDAANILGAGAWRVARDVTLPLALPAFTGGFILAFCETIALFGAPAILALPARIQVLTTQIYDFFQYPPRLELAAAYAMPLLLLSAGLLVLQRRALGRASYVTLTGKGGVQRRIRLGKSRYLLLGLSLLVTLCSTLVPYGVLLLTSVAKTWGAGVSSANLSLEHYAFALVHSAATRQALINSLKFGALAASAAIVLGAAAAYVCERRLVAGHHLLAFLAQAPYVIPGVVLGVGLFAVYTRPAMRLYGTLWILVLAYLTKFLPIVFTGATTSIKALGGELEEAARILGATRWRTMRDIVAPLVSRALLAAWVLVFISAMRELSSSVLLFTANTRTAAVAIYDLYSEGLLEVVAVIGIVLLAVAYGAVFLGTRLAGRSVLREG